MCSHFNYLFFFLLLCLPLFGENYSFSHLLKTCDTEQIDALNETKNFLDLSSETLFYPLEGGLTRAKLYSFEKEGKKYVLRFLALGPNQPKKMRQNEIHALKISGSLGIAPSCIFSDQHAVLMVMPFIEGKPFHKPNDFQLMQLGQMLSLLHSFSGFYPTKYTFQQRLERHYQKGVKAGIAYPTGFDQEVSAILNQVCSRPLVASHGDLNPSNILVGSKNISIIDWTNATWDDPFVNLSCICLLSNLSPEQERIFLNAYLGRKPSDAEYKTLQEEKAKVCLLTAAIWLRFSETLDDRSNPLEQRVEALDQELNSPSLKSAQDYLREGIVVDLKTAPKSEIKSFALSFYKAYLKAQVNNHFLKAGSFISSS